MSKIIDLLKKWFEPKEPEEKDETQRYFERAAEFGFGPVVMKRLKVCERCGEPADSRARGCVKCGAPLPEKSLYDLYCVGHRRCTNCYAVLSDDSVFCPVCGHAVSRAGKETA